MPLFEMTDIDFRTIEPTSFGNENVKERQDLQRLLKNHIDEIAPGCMVIKDEFSTCYAWTGKATLWWLSLRGARQASTWTSRHCDTRPWFLR